MSIITPSAKVDVAADGPQRLSYVVEMMREVSRQTDPQAMVREYAKRIRKLRPVDRQISLSRRELSRPQFRVTRYSGWIDEINPWKQKDRLPILTGGLFSEFLYGDEPRLIDDLQVDPRDPAAPYLERQRSLIALPLYDGGSAINMVVLTRAEPAAFPPESLPDTVLQSNLFGRLAHNLVLKEQLRDALQQMDRELQVVAGIQRSLLPARLPKIPTLDLATHYETSAQAGGDYYDFFPLPDNRWGIFIADVTGHGTPAAVVMAITHALAHTIPGPPDPPGRMLDYLNEKLCSHYTSDSMTFVTAFYGIYDPKRRTLTYASAGHPPPRLKRCDDGTMTSLNAVNDVPLGVDAGTRYEAAEHQLHVGDQIIFYTDGISEAFNPAGEQFGAERLDEILTACRPGAQVLIEAVLDAVKTFTAGRPADDDRTLLVAKVL